MHLGLAGAFWGCSKGYYTRKWSVLLNGVNNFPAELKRGRYKSLFLIKTLSHEFPAGRPE